MDRNIFRYVWRHSRRDQIAILSIVLASLPFYFASLDLPKRIVNEAIQGRAFENGRTTATLFELSFTLPAALGGETIRLFEGFQATQVSYLMGLSFLLLALVLINGGFKYFINISKGILGERMLRRMRFDLFQLLLRFRPEDIRLVKPAEAASVIKDEVEPIGGFIGDAFIQPAFLSMQAGTALVFIMVQHVWLGMLTAAVVAVQAFIIPILRKKQIELGRQRQIASRRLAGRVGEVVDGVAAVRGNGTETYERAEIGGRLGHLFNIRFELFKRKFAVKYLNNLLAQLTPFLFYTLGGYLVLKGSLDVGQLVAVIAAYRDVPPPVKELIDWDQQRNDVTVKYEQIIAQFQPGIDNEPTAQGEAPAMAPGVAIELDGVTLEDPRTGPLLVGVSATLTHPVHLALKGPEGGGKEALARVLGLQISRYGGAIRLAGTALSDIRPDGLPDLIGYSGTDPVLFPGSIRDNVLYGLKRRPPPLPAAAEVDKAEWRRRREAERSGNPVETIDGEWIDLRAAGVQSLEELDARLLAILADVGLGADIYRFGLSARIDPTRDIELARRLVEARHAVRERLVSEGKTRLVEPFDPDRFNRNSTMAENLLFGVAVSEDFKEERLASNALVRAVLDDEFLSVRLAEIGYQIATTSLEIFSGLPPGHPIFERYSFIRASDLAAFEEIITRAGQGARRLERAGPGRDKLISLALAYVEPRHRLGLVDPEIEERVVRARHGLKRLLAERPGRPVESYDPEVFTGSAPIRDNILFGRIGYGIANADEAVANILADTLRAFDLEEEVRRIGLDYQVGIGGKALFASQRNAVDLARSLIRRPHLLVVDGALAGHRRTDAAAILGRLCRRLQDCSLVATIPEDAEVMDGFECALMIEAGRLIAIEDRTTGQIAAPEADPVAPEAAAATMAPASG